MENGRTRFVGLGAAGGARPADERTADEIGSITTTMTGMLLADLAKGRTSAWHGAVMATQREMGEAGIRGLVDGIRSAISTAAPPGAAPATAG
ncbi:Beta-lactamase [[Actinomadura] parvosata subsp. kistnae]|nr:Beta-lactamase [Actinomadura parvosata subsp. kistnae]